MKSKSAIVTISLLALIILPFNNCGSPKSETDSASSASLNCELVDESLRSPNSIRDVVNLINAMPKPATIPCLIKNLNGPLNVYNVYSTFSAQPSESPASPRVFIIRPNVVISVVPSGSAKNLLELGEFVSTSQSVKGELEFPVRGPISVEAPYTTILSRNGNGTTCSACHIQEARAFDFGETAYRSAIMRPFAGQRVSTDNMYQSALYCNSRVDAYRCKMLKAIFIDGQARDVSFP